MRIEPNEALALAAVIRKDADAVRRLIAHGDSLARDPGAMDRSRLESLGYTLHNIYNALENAFTQISLSFENHVKERDRWHRELLEKMFLELLPLRPAVLPEECRHILGELLAFRHLFRRAHELELDASRVLELWRKIREEADTFLALPGAVQTRSSSLT